MNVNWISSGVNHKSSTTVIRSRTGDEVEFNTKVWNRIRVNCNNIFAPVNDYFDSASDEKCQKVFDAYASVHEEFYEGDILVEDHVALRARLQVAFEEIVDALDLKDFFEWLEMYGELHWQSGKKDKAEKIDIVEQTYFTQDYKDLLKLSCLCKLVMPFWGIYQTFVEKTLSKEDIVMTTASIFLIPAVMETNYFNKLDGYINYKLDNDLRTSHYSISSDIGSENVNEWMMANALTRKVATFDTREVGKSLISNVWNEIRYKVSELTMNQPIGKKQKNESDVKMGIADLYSVSQDTKVYNRIFANRAITTPFEMAKQVDNSITKSEVIKMGKIFDKDIKPEQFRLNILGIIFKDRIRSSALKCIDLNKVEILIIAGAALLEHWGFNTIAELLIVPPEVKDEDVVDFALTRGIKFVMLNQKMTARLDERYPYISHARNKSKNDGVLFIESILDAIVVEERDLTNNKFERLRYDLAEFLLFDRTGLVEVVETIDILEKNVDDVLTKMEQLGE